MKPDKMENVPILKKRIAGIVSRGRINREYFDLLRRLADLGETKALVSLGTFLKEGYRDSRGRTLLRRDPKASMQCFLLGAAKGNSYAMIEVADILASAGQQESFKEAEKMYKLAFRLGDANGAYNLACAYHGLGKLPEAVRWFKRSLAAGNRGALVPLAYAELYGAGVRRNVSAAFSKLRRIARGGKYFCQFDQEEAMLAMADALRGGWIVKRDFAAAIAWMRRAASLGSAAAKGYLQDYDACCEHDHCHA